MSNLVGKVVKVEWDDACSHNGWQSRRALTENESAWIWRVSSYGVVIADEPTHIAIAQSSAQEDPDCVGEVLFVPRPYIKRIVALCEAASQERL